MHDRTVVIRISAGVNESFAILIKLTVPIRCYILLDDCNIIITIWSILLMEKP